MGGTQSVWRNRDVRLLVTGATVNSIGDWLLELALPLFVFIETGSGIQTAFVYVLRLGVGFLFGPIGGRIADAVRLKPALVSTNLLQIAALGPLLVVTDERVWPIAVVVALQGLITSVNDPASFALLPRLVEGEQLVAANSAFSAGGSIARLVGAAAGGIALELGGLTTVAFLNAATFLVGAVTAWLLSDRANTRPATRDHNKIDTSVRAAIKTVRAHAGLPAILWVQGIAHVIFGGFPVLFIVFLTEYLGSGGSEVGVVRASSAIGGLLGAAAVGALAARIAPAHLMAGGYLLFCVVSFAFINAPPFTTAVWVYMVLYGATGFPGVASGVGTQSTAQLLSPPDILGRFGGLMSAVSNLGMGLGAVLAGVLLEVTTSRTLLNIEAGMFGICAMIAYLFIVRTTDPRSPVAAG